MFRLWNSGRQRTDVAVRTKENEAEEISRTIAELEGTLPELKQRLDRVKGDKGGGTSRYIKDKGESHARIRIALFRAGP